ncbi:spore germination protein [Paenibacillus oenotherae]|uniref:Spore germination protein n=1 Tax=Paenibacillus oenotherae TaxID=1435645 RepID=A0ABS7DB30_9BACL|nr:spore germination protein [Paenibacillus oenotherae]MBW7477060.1 spore germination protein [Paenibacillus oenotherae]
MTKSLRRSGKPLPLRRHLQEHTEPAAVHPLSSHLQDNVAALHAIYAEGSDVTFHAFQINQKIEAVLIFRSELCDTALLDRQILGPLITGIPDNLPLNADTLHRIVPVSSSKLVGTLTEASLNISSGHPILIVEGSSSALTFGLPKSEHRNVEEPTAESTLRGPREGFTESLTVNISLLRKRMKNPNFKMKSISIGQYTHTTVRLAYLEGVTDPAIVAEAMRRLSAIETDGILESEYIEEWISDQPKSPFPQMLSTERPDVVCANLLEGRFALLIDGTPFALVAPVTLFSMLQSPEDYYQHFMMSIFIRWLRYLFYFLSLVLPSAYVAITTYHQEMIPTVLLLSVAKAREEIPFPALIEALIMEIAFEALREAGVRLPKQVGAAVSIVGALIIGQAATTAGIVSAPMVIIVAITGIASFMIPRYSAGLASRLLRFPIMLLAGTLGLTGMMLGMMLIVIHLCGLRSFGVPYLSPVTPTSSSVWRDVFWRSPPGANRNQSSNHRSNRKPGMPIIARQANKR